MDSNTRSIAKAVSYRLLGSICTALIVLIFSGDIKISAGVGALRHGRQDRPLLPARAHLEPHLLRPPETARSRNTRSSRGPRCYTRSFVPLTRKADPAAVSEHIRKQLRSRPSSPARAAEAERFGEIAVPAAFQLAKQLRQAPKTDRRGTGRRDRADRRRGRARSRRQRLHQHPARPRRLRRGPAGRPATRRTPAAGEKIIVEHTNINPNKAAHIGHLRNAMLGDTFVRMLRAGGRSVEVQNYIDNTGVQVADVVVGFQLPGEEDASPTCRR